MNDFVTTLLRKNSLRKECNLLTVVELEKVLADLTDILQDRVDVEEEAQAAIAAKRDAVAAIHQQLEQMGLSLDDLDIDKPVVKRTVEAKYRLIDSDGKSHEWSGRGRTPKVFQERFENGAQKEDYLIQK